MVDACCYCQSDITHCRVHQGMALDIMGEEEEEEVVLFQQDSVLNETLIIVCGAEVLYLFLSSSSASFS